MYFFIIDWIFYKILIVFFPGIWTETDIVCFLNFDTILNTAYKQQDNKSRNYITRTNNLANKIYIFFIIYIKKIKTQKEI